MSLSSSDGDSVIGTQIGRVRLERLLGKGGMGEVYLGFDATLERRVAVKMIRADRRFDAETRARFLREARILSRLDHPGICRIYDLVEGEDNDYLILELAHGETLADLMEAGGLSQEQKLHIAEWVAEALAAAHEAQVVHRDLKPENVMVSTEGEVKVLDFGISRTEDAASVPPSALASAPGTSSALSVSAEDEVMETTQNLLRYPAWHDFETQYGSRVGTLRYMSPEQVKGLPASAAGDLYSLGIVLQELFTEERAYPDEGMSMQGRVDQVAAARTREIRDLDPQLTALLEGLTALDPQERPTAVEVVHRFQRIRERPARRRRQRRHRLQWAAVVVAFLLLGATALLAHRAAEAPLAADPGRARLVLLPFENAGGEEGLEWVEVGLRSLVAGTLAKVDGMTVVNEQAVEAALVGRGWQEEELTAPQAVALANDFGAQVVVVTEVSGVGKGQGGPGVRLTYSSYHVNGSIGRREIVATDPLAAAATLSRRLVQRLRPEAVVVELVDAFSADPMVNRLYAGGLQRHRRDGGAAAEPYFRVCLDLEPDFLPGRLALASALVPQGRFEEARALATAARRVAIERQDADREAAAVTTLATIAVRLDEAEEAERLLQRNLEIALMQEDLGARIRALGHLAGAARGRREWRQAERLALEALALQRQLGDPRGVASSLFELGASLDSQGKSAEARPMFREALEIYRSQGDRSMEARTLNSLGVIAGNLGEWDRAAEYYRRAVEAHRALGNRPSLALGLSNVAMVHLVQGEFAAGRPLLEEAYRLAEELDFPEGRGLAAINLLHLSVLTGDDAGARQYLPPSAKYYGEVWEVLLARAVLAAGTGDAREAARLVAAARQDAGELWEEKEEAVAKRLLTGA
jgi:tetratricopeptide (TPR) repeat protein/tRNA A-37 threonylcarbamoyl transferase component Bud32